MAHVWRPDQQRAGLRAEGVDDNDADAGADARAAVARAAAALRDDPRQAPRAAAGAEAMRREPRPMARSKDDHERASQQHALERGDYCGMYIA